MFYTQEKTNIFLLSTNYTALIARWLKVGDAKKFSYKVALHAVLDEYERLEIILPLFTIWTQEKDFHENSRKLNWLYECE